MSESFLDLKTRGSASAGVDTPNLLADVPRTYADLPASPDDRTVVVIRRGSAYRYADRQAFEMHVRASAGAWAQDGDDMPYYDFGESLTHAGGYVTLRLKFAAAPGGLSGGEVDGKAVAWAAHASTWTAGGAGRYEYRYASANNPLPQNGEITVKFTTANAVKVWYPEVNVAASGDFTPEDAFKLRALTSDSWATLPNALDQQGFFNAVPDISQLNARPYGSAFSWVGSSSSTFYKGFRVAASRRSEIGGFRALVGVNATTALTVLGDDGGFTYGYITLPNYVANTVITMQQPDKVGLDTGRIDLAEWRAALGVAGYGTLANLNAVANPVAGSSAVVYGDTIVNNGVYYRLNNAWAKISDGRTVLVYATQALLNRATPVDGRVAVVSEAAHRGVYLRLGGAWLLVGSVTAAQSGNAGATIADMLAALAADSPAGVVNRARIPVLGYSQLPANLGYMGKAFRRGGERDWPGDDLQMGQFVQQAAFSGLPQNYGFKQGNAPDGLLQVAVRDNSLGGALANNVHVLVRASKTTYSDRPTLADLPKMQMRLGYESESPVIRPALTPVAVVDQNYWYLDALIPQLPADANIYLEINEPPIIAAGVEDGIIEPSMLNLEGDPIEGGYYSYHDGQFQMRRAAGWQLLYRGSQGITVTNLEANNGLQRITYDESFNLNQAHDGYYLFEVSMDWVAGHDPSTLAFDTDGGGSVRASGQVALFQVKATAAYDGANNLGEVGLRIPVYAGAGSDTHIGDVVWRSDHENDFDGASNVRFEGISGTGISGSGGSISARAEIWYISSGAGSAGAHIPNSISTLFGFDDALPLATSYQVGTAALVDEGSQRGVWRNEDEIVEGTGLGLAGKSWDYQYDATQVVHGNRTWHIMARAAFTLADFPGVNFAAYGDLSDWPAEMEFIAFGYMTQGRSDGLIYIGFNADQSATNNVQFEAGGAGVAIVRQTNRLWKSPSISAANVGHIRQGVWPFTEPNATGASHTQRWRKIAGIGRRESLVDWTPAAPLNCPQNSLVQLPAAAALSRDLTEDDDGKELEIIVYITSDTGNAIPARLANAIVVPAGQWRTMTAAAVGNGFHQAPLSFFMSMGTNNTAGNVGQVLAAVSKGPNGRLGFISIFSNRNNRCRLLRVQMDLLG